MKRNVSKAVAEYTGGQPEAVARHHREGDQMTTAIPTATQAPTELMTDKELCALLRISPFTLRTHLRQGPPRKRHSNAGDIRMVHHVLIGGKRRWSKTAVQAFINGTD